jgi:hypothetical protein
VGNLCLGQRRRKHGAEQKNQTEFSNIQGVPP